MVRFLPPLNALRAFEAAARHQSFSLAAAELGVAHTAISRHVSGLESRLGVRLFDRTGRGVTLTEDGRLLALELTSAFDQIALATQRYAPKKVRRRALVISCDPAFAVFWLIPRLPRFTAEHTNLDLTVDPTPRLVDFRRERADVAIRFSMSATSWPGIDARHLASAEFTVVCSPRLASEVRLKPTPRIPPELMLQDRDRIQWQAWLKAAGFDPAIEPAGAELLSDLSIRAAEAGQGFALADQLIYADALKAGRLVVPVPVSISLPGYYLVTPDDRKMTTVSRQFADWLADEMKKTRIATAAGSPTPTAGPKKRRPAQRARKH